MQVGKGDAEISIALMKIGMVQKCKRRRPFRTLYKRCVSDNKKDTDSE